jgi:D-alanyl-D-alanine carboxypeptidase
MPPRATKIPFARLVARLLTLGAVVATICSFPSISACSLDPPFAAKLRPQIAARLRELGVPGAIVYVYTGDEGGWTATFGTSDLASGAPMDENSHVRIGSITKTLTGTAILRLVDLGEIGLDDPVAKYIPSVPNGGNITIRELLSMTSGLYNYSLDPAFNQTLDSDPGKVWQHDELLKIAFSHPPDFAPGAGYSYSNTNFILLGMIVEQLTHKPVAQVLQDEIFAQIGMSDTSLPALSDASIPSPHPRGYMYGTNVSSLNCQPVSPEQAGAPRDVTDANPSWGWTAGSAISTLHDLQIWAQALATGTLLSAATQQQRLAVRPGGVPGEPAGVNYGLAIVQFPGDFIGHNGELPGFQSFMAYSPEKDGTIIVLTNVYQATNCTGPADDIARLILQQVFSV